MKLVGLFLLTLLMPSLGFTQQQVGTMESIGLGRSRLRCPMVERRGIPVKAQGLIEVGKIEFRERWLQKELPRLFPGLDTVDVVDRVLARSGLSGAAATAERILEIVGSTADVEAARIVIRRLLSEPERTLRFRLWAAVVRYPEDRVRPSKAEVQLLAGPAIDQQLEEIATDESATVFEQGKLEFLNGRSASISVGSRISYVKDYKLSQAGDRLFLEPVVASFKEGMQWSIGAVYNSTTKKIALDSSFHFVQVQKPIAKFKGVVGVGNKELTIEKPILAETEWESSGLVCGPEHAGFVVTGIKLRDINGMAGEHHKAEMVLVARFEIERLSGQKRSGSVQGFDRAARLAFVRIKHKEDFEVGMKLEFTRGEDKVASGRVTELVGQMITVEVDDGEVKAGDQIR
ncbi:MAG: hypothetical protein ACI97A_002316 [Planctomycetota bacterium]|jgi:hypothetical protein